VPIEDPTGHWEGEETLDVEWAHAIAPGAKIDIIEVNDDSNWPSNLLTGDALAASLPDVSAVSNSWGLDEWSGETAYDSSTFATPSGHTGVTFLTASNDNGAKVYGGYGPTVGSDGYYPATSPNVVSVGGTELTVDNNGYGSETGWSYPAPASTIDNGSSSYSQTGSWSSHSGGFSGTYSTAPGGSSSSATWTIAVTPANTGWGTEVSATWTASASNATNATYSISDGTTGTLLATVPVNQSQAPVGTADGSYQFQELGVFFPTLDSNGDGTLTVVLNASSANGTVVADAVGAAQAWASTGGPSQFESEPSFQLPFQSTGFRTTPDVSFDASQNSGVTTYYTVFNDPTDVGLFYGGFGTSLGSPCWAGLIAIANQGRVAYGGSPLNSSSDPQETLQALYSLTAGDFHDITTGYNGFGAGPGYDFVTGRGAPIANTLIPALAAYDLSLTLSPSTLPVATVGDSYGPVTITATGGSGSYTFALASGKLPAGLTLTSSGVLSGKPTTSIGSPFKFTITATDNSNSGLTGSQAYMLTVDPAITIGPTTLAVATVGDAVNDKLTAKGGSGTGYTFAQASGSNLPSGLTLSSAGAITGTPTQSGKYAFTIVATDSIGATGSHAYSLTVDPEVVVQPPATIPIATVDDKYPSNVQFTASGGSGTGYTFKATGLPSGMTITSAGFLSGTPTKAGTYNISVTVTDSDKGTGSVTVQLTVDPAIVLSPTTLPVATIGDGYSQKLTATGGSGSGYAFALASGSSLPPGLSLSGGLISGNVTTAGTYTFTVVATDSIGATGGRTYTMTVDPPITVSPSTLPPATIVTKYTETLTASGGSGTGYSFTDTGLPSWLTLSSAGTLSGTPPIDAPSQITFMVTVTDSKKGSDTVQYRLTIDS
jgi:hypothetical protein